MPLATHPLYLVAFALVLLGASGLGRAVLGSAPLREGCRSTLAQGLVGIMALSACFALAIEAQLSFQVTALGLGVLTLAGLCVAAWTLLRQTEMRRPLVTCWLVGVGLLALVSWLPVNQRAADPANYAFGASTVLQTEWVHLHLAGNPLAALAGTDRTFDVSRAASIALLWPWSALGWGLSPAIVAETAQWLTVVSFLLLTDALDGRAPLAGRLLLAAAGIGAFNEQVVLTEGQIGQAFGLAVAVAGLWLDRYLVAGWARGLALGLVGFSVATGYTELLAALPLYVGGACLLRPRRWRDVLLSGAVVVAGAVAANLVTHGDTLRYLLAQAGAGPSDFPLPQMPHNPLDVWQAALFEAAFPRALVVLVLPLAGAAFCLTRDWRAARPATLRDAAALLGSGAVLVVLTLAVLRGGNPNYGTFKMSGWIGPALVVAGWLAIGLLSGAARQVLSGGLYLLGAYRALGLLWAVGSLTAAYLPTLAAPPGWQVVSVTPGAGTGCVLQVEESGSFALEVALAESAAARLGCSLPEG